MKALPLILLVVCVCGAFGANLDFVASSHCGPVCANYCFFGRVYDSHGCPTCGCKPAPSTAIPHSQIGCLGVFCDLYCPNGYNTDSNGCNTCSCKTSSLDNLVVSKREN